jgi:hypothetical protein
MIDFKTLNIEPGVLKLMSKRTALELTVLPIAQKNDVVIVAVPEMFRRRLLTDVRFFLGKKKKIKPVSASHDSIIAAIHHFYGISEH